MNLSELFIRRPVMTVALSVSVILFRLVAYFSCRSAICRLSTIR